MTDRLERAGSRAGRPGPGRGRRATRRGRVVPTPETPARRATGYRRPPSDRSPPPTAPEGVVGRPTPRGPLGPDPGGPGPLPDPYLQVMTVGGSPPGSMPTHCPLCGSEAEYAETAGPVALGRCAGCGGVFTVITGLSGTLAPGATPEPNGDSATVAAPDGDRPEPMRARRPDGPRWTNRDDSRGPPRDAPRSRPCRECGGQLTFSTGPDGAIVGECASCGNRFSLPPRRDGDRGGYGGGGYGGRSYSGRRPGFRPGGGGRPPWGRSGGGGGRPFNRRPRSDGDEGDRRPRRRRPRDDE